MKPHFHKIPSTPQSSFSIRHDVKPDFGNIWHYHPELELHYIIKGEGVRFIGDNISNFTQGEMILLGENLPHTWRCKDEYFQNNPDLHVEAMVIQFLPDCLGKYLLNLPEAYLIPKLFEKAKSGMVINGKTRDKLAGLMKSAIEATNLDRIIILLSILKTLAETDEYAGIVTGKNTFYQSNESETQRINKICTYTMTNYKKDITLEEIASLSNLSITSFCRYFKLMTKKTYYDFLIEIRVSHACRFLIENKLPTEMICFDCGFNNVSNFYRHFKKVTGMTPLDYKRKYLNE
ncbi:MULTISPECIES: AraC family transcriptional regulator [Pedobacter]|uniref:Helix-turn-helix-domain containing protein AraC type n=1 Tax=Pedobacter heparinus (strain ATCC 13125 / DSM 2366 / CIP 104194 / JCM 7457 / NBRC 12017 / NCIMB 9290 / NRRL B-14731 / HIM 762-3) TaxID=485917 RepID=C6Y1M0_PEDHD|nr:MULTISPECIES: AraC family transcriptional regulator [Pedobacter]ACU05012.1 helix-turn-helix- domain containing protein AraC type [Pedobacter heparinus DSM 2366]MBB5437757.1 AraC-like DNA-binding protein [Pedobacter sp. AK017]